MPDEFISIRIRLQDARKFAADAGLDAAAIRGVSDAADRSGKSFDRASKSGFAHSQMLYTLRRGAFYATTALAGLASGAVLMGINFNSTMEQNTISLSHFLGSTSAAKAELSSLYTLAAQTPFEFPQLTGAATRFLAFGFSLKETNADLKVIGDTAAGLGAGAEGIDRLVLVFGQMHATGRVLGNDLLQLAALGVPALQILQKQLGLTADQMRQLQQGNLVIPSSVAIPALIAGLKAQFGGLSRLQAQTFQGLTSTAHDYFAQLSGVVTHPLFVTLEKDLERLNPLLLQLQTSFRAGGWDAFFQTLDQGVGANGHLVTSFQQLRAIGQDLWRIFTGAVIPGFELLWSTVGLGSPPMRLLVGLLGLATRHMTLLRIAVGLVAVRMLYLRAIALETRIAVWLLEGSFVGLDAAMAANPIGILIIGAAALGAGLGYLTLKTDILQRSFAAFGAGAVSIARTVAGAFTWLGDTIATAIRTAINFIIGGWDSLHFRVPGFSLGPVHFGGFNLGVPHIPLLATGGVIEQTGVAVVHRNEIVQPAKVSPLNLGSVTSAMRELHVHLHMNGREVAEEVFSYQDVVDRGVWGRAVFAGGRA